LSIDADERVSPELAESIRRAIPTADAAGYELCREMYFLRKRLRFGGVGTDWPLRLFRRTKGRYRPAAVHERIEVQGPVARLTAPLLHYSYASLAEYHQKCDHYTTLAAEEQFQKGRRFSPLDIFRPVWELFQRVVLRGAWLDGRAGLLYAALSARATWLRSIKLRRLAY
jgi:hypothetical protein